MITCIWLDQRHGTHYPRTDFHNKLIPTHQEWQDFRNWLDAFYERRRPVEIATLNQALDAEDAAVLTACSAETKEISDASAHE